MSERICSEPGCGARITRQSKTGRCRPHAIARMQADPAYQAARQAGIDRHYAVPGRREAKVQQLTAARLEKIRNDPAERERLREHGRWLCREVLTAERRARAQAPEARARSVANYIETVMGWCPAHLRPEYRRMIDSQKIPAAEARRILEAEIPGTAEYARREIHNRELISRLRDERRRAEAY
jgi:hypothetical protein